MSSLYQTERPTRFSDMIGQEQISNTLRAQVRAGKLAHAYLFIGPAGCGKTTYARIIAKAANCECPVDGEPCGECDSCKSVAAEENSDILELDAASNNGVDDIRKIIENVSYKATGRCKVVILDECHMLSPAASNALLKTLEEPPKNVIFVLCTTEENKVLDPIKSRCQQFNLQAVPAKRVAAYLEEVCKKYNKTFEKDALVLISLHSGNSVRTSLSLLESFMDVDNITTEAVAERLGIAGEDATFDILKGVATGDIIKSLTAVEGVLNMGRSVLTLVRSIFRAIRDTESLLYGAEKDSIFNTEAYKARLFEFAASGVTVDMLDRFAAALSDKVLSHSADKLNLDLRMEAAIRTAVEQESAVADLVRRVKALEDRVAKLEAHPVAALPENRERHEVETSEEIEEKTEAEESSEFSPVMDGEDIPFDVDDLSDFHFSDESVSQVGMSEPAPEPDNVVPFQKTEKPVGAEEKAAPAVQSEEEPVKEKPAEKPSKVKLPKGVEVETISAADFLGDSFTADSQKPDVSKAGEAAKPLVPSGDDLPPLGFSGFLWQ